MSQTKSKYKRSDVPTPFCKNNGYFANNVGELKTFLEMLPDDLPLGITEFHGMAISVANNGAKSPGVPFVCIEEIDVDEWGDQQ